jgi:hypothetical protein
MDIAERAKNAGEQQLSSSGFKPPPPPGAPQKKASFEDGVAVDAARHGRAGPALTRMQSSGAQTTMANRATDLPPMSQPRDTVKRVIKQGWLTKQGGASGGIFSRETWKRRWVTLDRSRLTWADNEKALPKGEVFIKVPAARVELAIS